MDLFGHLKTIREHRAEVRRGCFRLGLFYQGLTHDLSKYSPSEFWIGVKYYQGFRSPNNAEREKKGYSDAWMHHKGRNKHHYEYWTDYCIEGEGKIIPIHMPNRYLAEMYADRIAASKTYKKDAYNDTCPLEYYMLGTNRTIMDEDTRKELEALLTMLSKEGEEKTEQYIRTVVLKGYFGAQLAELKYKFHKRRNANK